MNIIFDKPIKTYQGEGWYRDTKVEVYQNDTDDFTIFTIDDGKHCKEIKYRNVGSKNKSHTIQFDITDYNLVTKRTRDISFAIPLELVDLFLKGLSNKAISADI